MAATIEYVQIEFLLQGNDVRPGDLCHVAEQHAKDHGLELLRFNEFRLTGGYPKAWRCVAFYSSRKEAA